MKTEQVVSTPADLIEAVEKRFGPIKWDLAANAENAKSNLYLGPGSTYGEDALVVDWATLLGPGDVAWLNCPFGHSARWTAKCRSTIDDCAPSFGWKILQLLPASVCTDYVRQCANGVAYRLELSPRPFKVEVKDCMLLVWSPEKLSGIAEWRWK